MFPRNRGHSKSLGLRATFCGVGCRLSAPGRGEGLDSPFLIRPLKPPNCGEIVGLVNFRPHMSPSFYLVASRHTNALSPSSHWPTPSQGDAKTVRALGSRPVGEGGDGADRRSGAANLSAHTSFSTGAGAPANPPPLHLRLRGAPRVGSGVNNWPEVWLPILLYQPLEETRGYEAT